MVSFKFSEYLRPFRNPEKPSYNKELVRFINEIFKNSLPGASWVLYGAAVMLVMSCLYYFYYEHRNRQTHDDRTRKLREIIESPPPQRRPGAAGREREIFQNILKTAYSYIYPGKAQKAYVVRQSASGKFYGMGVTRDQNS